MARTPLDSIREKIALRRGGIPDTTVGRAAHRGGRIESGLFPASHTLEELARMDRPGTGAQAAAGTTAGTGAPAGRALPGRGSRRVRGATRQPGFFRRTLNAWWGRLLASIYSGDIAGQEAEYEEHATRRDYIWNTAGTAIWGFVFPLLTIVSTQLAGAEQAGMFSMAFVTGTLLMIACNYGVRNFQVSDIDEAQSFVSYQVNRWILGVAALLIGILYVRVRGYAPVMAQISLGVYVYKVVDGVADVYEGRLQQADKLYLAGISQAVRSAGVVAVFSLLLLITRSMRVASIGMAVCAVASLVLLTLPLALLETEKSRRARASEVVRLFRQCAPLFCALMLFNLIESMPKFVMESALPYKNQLYFNALFFPAQGILLAIGFVYKPQLLTLSNIWASPSKRKKFDLIIFAVLGVIVAITAAVWVFMGTWGIGLLSMLYGLDFERFRTLAYLMVLAGGVTAAIDFIYAIVTVLRRAGDVMRAYLICFAASVVVPLALVNLLGLTGAVVSYLAVMTLLLVLLIVEYYRIRQSIDHARDPFRRVHKENSR